jgi:hypothetical protein
VDPWVGEQQGVSSDLHRGLKVFEFIVAFVPMILLWMFALLIGGMAVLATSYDLEFAAYYYPALITGGFGLVGIYQLHKVAIKSVPIEISTAAFLGCVFSGWLSLLLGYLALLSISADPVEFFFLSPIAVSMHFLATSRKNYLKKK